MEQPASSLLWIFPELSRLLEQLCMTRVHTWMKNFGHRLPKPSVLMSTVVPQYLKPLEGKWSKKMERAWARLQTKMLMGITPIRNLMINKHWFLVCMQHVFSSTKETAVCCFKLKPNFPCAAFETCEAMQNSDEIQRGLETQRKPKKLYENLVQVKETNSSDRWKRFVRIRCVHTPVLQNSYFMLACSLSW